MSEVIYSTSPLQILLLTGVVVIAGFLMGALGIWNGVRRRHEKMPLRIARGCAGVFFTLLGLAFGGFVVMTMLTGADTITVKINDKQIATDNCDSGSGTCQRYVLEAQSGSRFYDIEVDEAAYEKAQIDSCYEVTYYAFDRLFGMPTVPDPSITNATRIETAACR